MLNFLEAKVFGWFTHPDYRRMQFRIICVWHGFYITHYININNLDEGLPWEWIKWLLLWHSFFGFQVLFVQSFVSIWVKELKYLIIWDSSFWSTSLWGCSLEFLSIIIVIIVSANWRVVFDLKIPSWLFLDTKLNTLFFQFALV